MRRALLAAVLAAAALSGTGGGTASAEGPLNCNHPWYYRPCTAVNAAYDMATEPVPTVECNHPWYYRVCKTVTDLVGTDG